MSVGRRQTVETKSWSQPTGRRGTRTRCGNCWPGACRLRQPRRRSIPGSTPPIRAAPRWAGRGEWGLRRPILQMLRSACYRGVKSRRNRVAAGNPDCLSFTGRCRCLREPNRSSCAVPGSNHGISPSTNWRAATVVIPTGATRTVKPLPFAAIRVARVRVTAHRIFI